MKRTLMTALIVIIILQIFVPTGMVINKYDLLRNGEEYRFKVRPIDPYDPFRGRYVSIAAEDRGYKTGKYGTVEVDSEGYARISNVSDTKPEGKTYIKSVKRGYFALPIDRYYMDEKLAPEAEKITFSNETKIHVTLRVKNGNAVVSGLFANDIPIEEYIMEKNKQ